MSHGNTHQADDPLPRVLFVDQSGELGGAELSLLDIAAHWGDRGKVLLFEAGPFVTRLRNRGIRVEVLSSNPPHPDARGISSRGHDLAYTRTGGLAAAARSLPGVIRLIREVSLHARGCDILHANTQKAFVVAALAGRLARRPVVWHLRDILTADHFSGFNRKVVVTLANRLAARVIANSRATADAFVEAGGRADRVRVVYNAVPEPTAEKLDDRSLTRRGSDRTIGVFARLAPWKGQHVVIDAMTRLPDHIRLLIVGGPLFGEDAYEAQLRERIQRLRLGGRVEVRGFVQGVSQVMQKVDVVVHSSTSPEPFGRVIVEAMLAGTPVVASDAGGAREILQHERTGLLFPPGDAAALADAVSRLLDDPTLAARIAAAALADARERFTLPRLLREMEASLRDFRTKEPRTE